MYAEFKRLRREVWKRKVLQKQLVLR
jgi:hypothetical protein